MMLGADESPTPLSFWGMTTPPQSLSPAAARYAIWAQDSLIEIEGDCSSDADGGEECVAASVVARCDGRQSLSLAKRFSILWRWR